MFRNIGRKIKNTVTVLFWVAVGGSFIYGIVTCVATRSAIGLLVPVEIFPVALIASYFLYGFGELVDCTQHNAYYLEEIYKNMSKSGNQNMVTGQQPQGQPQQLNAAGWECPGCKKVNSGEATFCVSCGKRRF